MIKTAFIHIALMATIILSVSCSNKKEGSDDHSESSPVSEVDWKEMDDFHMVMAESFHPYKDSANLEPAKQNASALVASAEKWAAAPLPAKFEEDDEIKFKLNQLHQDAVSFVEIVNSGNDKAIGESLTKLHDLFHELQESWYGDHSKNHN
jgi:hypothetical protein